MKVQDNDNMTPLQLALQGPPEQGPFYDKRRDMIAQLLLVHGASVHVRDQNNQTPLHLASQHQYPSTVVLLLKLGTDMDP